MSTKKSGIDQQLIRDLAEILNETHLTEIEIEQDDLRIRVSRQAAAVQAVVPAPVSAAVAAPAASVQSAPATSADPGKNAVPSPMVGTAYRAPSPDAQACPRS